MRPLVIYHAHCPDGFTAAWVAARALGDVELFEGRYGEEPPLDLAHERRVYVVDFSYPREKMLALHDVCAPMPDGNQLTVLDHHKTAEADCRGLPFCTFDMERSGAGLAWDHFHPGQPRPWVVSYVEDRDLWRFYLPGSREVSLFVRTTPHKLESWDALAELNIAEAVESAMGCKRYLDHYVRDALRNAYELVFNWSDPDEPDDFKAQRFTRTCCVNVSYTGISDVLHEALETHPECELALGWHVASDGRINCSLRSRSGFDCSVFARARGGGGHAQASGFRLSPDHPFTKMLVRGGDGRVR